MANNHHIATEKVDCLAAVLFIVGLGLLAYFEYCHLSAGVAAALGIAVAVRQFILGRIVDVIVALVMFGGIFCSLYWRWDSSMTVPILLTLGSIYYIIKRLMEYRHRRHGGPPAEYQEQLSIDEGEEH